MNDKTRKALLGYGISTELIDKIATAGHTTGSLRESKSELLRKDFSEEEVKELKTKLQREEIPVEAVDQVVAASNGVCCLCADGNKSRPYQLHHIQLYSETQDNSYDNIALVCPTHHVAIHANKTPPDAQKVVRNQWYKIAQLASEYQKKGIPFPFDLLEAVDYSSPANARELVQLGPLSPSTASLSYSPELAHKALASLERDSFVLVFGDSGSGKSTFALAVGGLIAGRGVNVFRLRFGKQRNDTLQQLLVLFSTCVEKTLIIVDDINVWATASDIERIARAAGSQHAVQLLATATTDDSADTARLRASDIPKLFITWSQLRPAVIEALIRSEGEIVEDLQKYESKRSIGSLGVGSLEGRLDDRIQSLGGRPKTVYEFIFGLRGDELAAEDELEIFASDGRSDIAIVYAAIQQIAGFERPVSVAETVGACERANDAAGLQPISVEWVNTVFKRGVASRRLVSVRDQVTTIHRKWAAQLIAAAMRSEVTSGTTATLLEPFFDVRTAEPAQLLRLWSWLQRISGTREFVAKWAKSLKQEDCDLLVERSAAAGLLELGFLAAQMHLLFSEDAWKKVVAEAFNRSEAAVMTRIRGALPDDWYWLRQLSMLLSHSAPHLMHRITESWQPTEVARLILETHPDRFESASWFLNSFHEVNPDWLRNIGQALGWEAIVDKYKQIHRGDLHTLINCFGLVVTLGYRLRRSMLRRLSAGIGDLLTGAGLRDLRLDAFDVSLTTLAVFFPDDAREAFDTIDTDRLGRELSTSLPRDWRTLCELSNWARFCNSSVTARIIETADLSRLLCQVDRYAVRNRYEFRTLIHFLRSAEASTRTDLARALYPFVQKACAFKDSESEAILSAFSGLDPELAKKISDELAVPYKVPTPVVDRRDFSKSRQRFKELDESGEDYEIDSAASDESEEGTATDVPAASD